MNDDEDPTPSLPESDLEDLLEQLRVLLNKSKIEQMHYFHTHSSFGKECSYYQKSKKLWEAWEKAEVLALLGKIQEKIG